ncbi:NAD(P)-dependent oxidoreductase [Plantibacter sp. Leaf171]|uniref:SDR family oxidoreductase n=1 Tax=unclassified Plantibacter TaxID=2624265 RepID=UPI0006F20175|nr:MULTISPECIES: SDR family oxidoreductase [unclassified Plantibacter]KQM16075.1 NAD(P)-dependent oxidoreductase [Plantibacter sp. Leaf1]KQR59215.1 NAD(P)-dependent oxidoreductase [Plantibacter sp. Leaf171]
MSLVVTGATGHLGHLVVEHLLARGTDPASIVATGRRTEALADLAAQGVRTATVDFADPSTLDAALEAGDTVLLVSSSEVGQRVAQHANVIDAAKRAGVARIVYTSASKADTSPLILAPEHKATEELLRASGVPFTILRNGWYTENYGQAVDQAKATGSFVGSVGDGRVSSASRTDYAEAAAVVLTTDGHEGAVYELSGDVAWTQPELAQAIGELIGREVTYQDLSPEDHSKALLAAGLDEGTVGFVVALDGNTRDGLLGDTSGDLSRLIGRPTTPLVEGLRPLVG